MLAYVWASPQETLSLVFANIKGGNKPVHPRSLISVVGIHLLERIIHVHVYLNLLLFVKIDPRHMNIQ